MLNYWWVTRPKRKLDSIPEILSCFAEVSLDCEWQGNVYSHLAFEEALERRGLKRVGERRDQRGGGGRTYYVWLSSLGLVYKDEKSGQSKLTEAGEAIVQGRNPEQVLSGQVMKYQFPSPFSMSAHSAKTRVHDRFRISCCIRNGISSNSCIRFSCCFIIHPTNGCSSCTWKEKKK